MNIEHNYTFYLWGHYSFISNHLPQTNMKAFYNGQKKPTLADIAI